MRTAALLVMAGLAHAGIELFETDKTSAVRVVAHPSTNSLILRAGGDDLKLAKAILTALDQETPQRPGKARQKQK